MLWLVVGAILGNIVKLVTKVASKTAGKAASKAIAAQSAKQAGKQSLSLMDAVFLGSMAKDRQDYKKQAKQQKRYDAINDIAQISSQSQYDLISKI